MRKLWESTALAGAAIVLTSFSPGLSFSPDTLAMLDPTRLASSLCGGRSATATLAHQLVLAAAVAGPVGAASDRMPLYSDLTGSRLPVTTADEQARRYFNQGLLLTYGFNHAGITHAVAIKRMNLVGQILKGDFALRACVPEVEAVLVHRDTISTDVPRPQRDPCRLMGAA